MAEISHNASKTVNRAGGHQVSAHCDRFENQSSKVVGLQRELLASKGRQFNGNLKITAVASVDDKIKEELQSYRNIFSKSTKSVEDRPPLDQNTLKTIVRDVVAEDRSRNLMKFGLPEDTLLSERSFVGAQ